MRPPPPPAPFPLALHVAQRPPERRPHLRPQSHQRRESVLRRRLGVVRLQQQPNHLDGAGDLAQLPLHPRVAQVERLDGLLASLASRISPIASSRGTFSTSLSSPANGSPVHSRARRTSPPAHQAPCGRAPSRCRRSASPRFHARSRMLPATSLARDDVLAAEDAVLPIEVPAQLLLHSGFVMYFLDEDGRLDVLACRDVLADDGPGALADVERGRVGGDVEVEAGGDVAAAVALAGDAPVSPRWRVLVTSNVSTSRSLFQPLMLTVAAAPPSGMSTTGSRSPRW